jgi:hypothetical protein
VKIAIYARVSTNNGQDPEMQLRELREYCQRRGCPDYSRLLKNRTISTAANTNQKASNSSRFSGGKMRRTRFRALTIFGILFRDWRLNISTPRLFQSPEDWKLQG